MKKTVLKKSAAAHAVKESERSKKLSSMETEQELQRDIQSMYNEAKKVIAKNDKHENNSTMETLLRNIKHYVDETKDISRMKLHNVQDFWNSAYTQYEGIKNLSK